MCFIISFNPIGALFDEARDLACAYTQAFLAEEISKSAFCISRKVEIKKKKHTIYKCKKYQNALNIKNNIIKYTTANRLSF
jgi:hypothetical protein